MIAVLTGLSPDVIARQPREMFEALVEECDRAQWSPLTELVARLVEMLGGPVTRPSWLRGERVPQRLKGRAAVDYMAQRGGVSR